MDQSIEHRASAFPDTCRTVGQKVEYLSLKLLPEGRFDEYLRLMGQLLHENVHYVDPVHELHRRDDVLAMLARYVPRTRNDKFRFELISDGERDVIWTWTISLRIRFSPFDFVINGLVRARVEDGQIVYQREYYDPMESIEKIPLVGKLYKLVLKMG